MFRLCVFVFSVLRGRLGEGGKLLDGPAGRLVAVKTADAVVDTLEKCCKRSSMGTRQAVESLKVSPQVAELTAKSWRASLPVDSPPRHYSCYSRYKGM